MSIIRPTVRSDRLISSWHITTIDRRAPKNECARNCWCSIISNQSTINWCQTFRTGGKSRFAVSRVRSGSGCDSDIDDDDDSPRQWQWKTVAEDGRWGPKWKGTIRGALIARIFSRANLNAAYADFFSRFVLRTIAFVCDIFFVLFAFTCAHSISGGQLRHGSMFSNQNKTRCIMLQQGKETENEGVEVCTIDNGPRKKLYAREHWLYWLTGRCSCVPLLLRLLFPSSTFSASQSENMNVFVDSFLISTFVSFCLLLFVSFHFSRFWFLISDRIFNRREISCWMLSFHYENT